MKQLTADNSLCSQGVEQKEFLCSAGNDQWELPPARVWNRRNSSVLLVMINGNYHSGEQLSRS